jgi:hypothetical protein
MRYLTIFQDWRLPKIKYINMIAPTLVRMIVREHMYKPVMGRVLILGRQTVGLTPEQLVELLKQENYPISDQTLKILKAEHDNETRMGKKVDSKFISDKAFFRSLGINQFNNMDISTYEGADIIHDLNEPAPTSLEGQFDFIIDGGTFDHLLDLRTAFENVVKMLKVGGRVFQWNAASNYTGANYISFSPDIFYDYYSLNKFADCKVYIGEVDSRDQGELWDVYEFMPVKYRPFYSNKYLMTIVLAEKGPDSTYDKIPVEDLYRDEHLRQAYKDSQKAIASSKRRPYEGSSSGMRVGGPTTGKPARRSFLNKVISRYRDKGLAWVVRKSFNRVVSPFSEKNRRQDIEGYRYVGKI